jgi:carboxymethylenebutenolidase
MGDMITLTAEDGHTLSGYRAAPQGTARGGLVIVQEIFGVNSHIRRVTDGFAADGFVALAPAIFDRAEPGFMTGYRQEDIDRGRAVRMKIPLDDMVKDIRAAVRVLEGGGHKIGVAEHAQEKPRCPVLLHWGETDQSIPPDHWKKVSSAHPDLPVHVYPAGHGFNCDERGSYHEASAKLARTRTLAFLKQHLG